MIRMEDVKKIIKKCPVCGDDLSCNILTMYGCSADIERRHFMCYSYGIDPGNVYLIIMRYGLHNSGNGFRFQRHPSGLWSNGMRSGFTDDDMLALISVRE